MPDDGCVRGTPPCAPFSGIRDVLRAVASQQKAGGDFEVLVSIFGVPDWAAAPPSGCERADATPRSRPINDQGLVAYQALIRSLYGLGVTEGVPLALVEPVERAQRDVLPQPAARGVRPLLAAGVARSLHEARPRDAHRARAAPGRAEARRSPSSPGLSHPRLRGSGIEEFYAGLPDDVVCTASVYAQHAYAERNRPESARLPVEQLEAALDKRPCTKDKPIWITETGVGGPDVGGERIGGLASLRRDCRALDEALRRWDLDPRVEAAFQYTFRDDPAFPVGLADAGLTRTWPAYDEWLAWGGDRAPARTGAGPARRLRGRRRRAGA